MSIREAQLSQFPLCAKCLPKLTVANEVDHVIPLDKGGTDAPDNLQSLCHDCHADKTAKDTGKQRKPRIGLDGWPV